LIMSSMISSSIVRAILTLKQLRVLDLTHLYLDPIQIKTFIDGLPSLRFFRALETKRFEKTTTHSNKDVIFMNFEVNGVKQEEQWRVLGNYFTMFQHRLNIEQ
jgi:hypothetical protein